MAWTADDIEITVDDLGTSDPVLTARIATPAGDLMVMAEPRMSGRRVTLEGLHLHGVALRPGELGVRRLLWLAQAVMEKMDVDEIVIRGAARTSGANPGRRQSVRRFVRKAQAAG